MIRLMSWRRSSGFSLRSWRVLSGCGAKKRGTGPAGLGPANRSALSGKCPSSTETACRRECWPSRSDSWLGRVALAPRAGGVSRARQRWRSGCWLHCWPSQT